MCPMVCRLPLDNDGFFYAATGNGDFTNTLDANGFPANG